LSSKTALQRTIDYDVSLELRCQITPIDRFGPNVFIRFFRAYLPMTSDHSRRCIVTGGSAGLGLEVAAALLARGDRVLIAGRDEDRLNAAIQTLRQRGLVAPSICKADVSTKEGATLVCDRSVELWDGLDVLVNVVGTSDRGMVQDLTTDRLDEMIRLNVHPTLLCCQAAKPSLEKSKGVIINVGSLAGKVGARYIGAYPAAKHALSGLTQQLRLEWRPLGIHVGIIQPGPIRRDDEGTRYSDVNHLNLPEQASRPGGGTRVKGVPPQKVASAILRMIDRRSPDVILPGYLRILIGIGNFAPRLGDWLLLKFTSSRAP
jgi:uncharacterized protein